MTNFNVILLDASQTVISSVNYAGQAGTTTTIQISGNARYVKVQLVGSDYLALAEVKVWGPVRWLVPDQLGTPRITLDQTGSLANTSRHDYLPFGEEVPAGFRSGIPGYATADNVRQKFTKQERDNETGLDYFQARYYSSAQGRFTSPDSICGCTRNPQTQNLYTYVLNNPLRLTDPTGNIPVEPPIYDPKKEARERRERYIRALDIESLKESGILPDDFGDQDALGPNRNEIRRDFYSGPYGKAFNECLTQVFGTDAPDKQTLDNAPDLITIEPSDVIAIKAGASGLAHPTGSVIPPKNGKGGGIKIAFEYADSYGLKPGVSSIPNNDVEVMFTYGHELANLLDMRINPNGKNGKKPGFVYGKEGRDPKTGKKLDADTGQAMETCMKSKLE